MEILSADLVWIFNQLAKLYYQIDEELKELTDDPTLFWKYPSANIVSIIGTKVSGEITFHPTVRGVLGALFHQLVSLDILITESIPYFKVTNALIIAACSQYGLPMVKKLPLEINIPYLFRTLVNETREGLGKATFPEEKKE